MLAVALATPAAAHTSLDFASPGPGVRVSEPVDRIQLGFADPVEDPVVTLLDPAGDPVTGRVEVIDEYTLAFVLDGLTQPGEYVVQYRVSSPDDDAEGDLLESAYAFTYLGDSDDGGSNALVFLAVAAGLAVVAAPVAWRVLRAGGSSDPTG
ncbi:MAG: copper resistance protein CopC [Acidimicrobiia bacterium]|nr:copper resistance protein CopC [Acidimicrobiia bacterium]